MSQNPRFRADWTTAITSSGSKPDQSKSVSEPLKQRSRIAETYQTLSAHGAGAASFDLAFDLVLHEIADEAREITHATGAAIALFRDGELVCRAAAGSNAPELGTRVNTVSSLGGTFVSTEIQKCDDTEIGSRVNVEICRRLGVRSMLTAPIDDDGTVVGILQVFSDGRNAFGSTEVEALRRLVMRTLETTKGLQSELTSGLSAAEESRASDVFANRPPIAKPDIENVSLVHRDEIEAGKLQNLWNSILFILALGAAISLGFLLGWRTRVRATGAAVSVASSAGSVEKSEVSAHPPGGPTPAASKLAVNSKAGSHLILQTPAVLPSSRADTPALVITENGKVVYRSFEDAASIDSSSLDRPKLPLRLLHRVDPEYPAEARAQQIQGPVVLDVAILASGTVENVTVVSGDPLLVPAAVRAVQQWQFEPYSEGGRTVESQTRVTVRFTLPSM